MLWGRMISVSFVFLVFDWAGWLFWFRGGMEIILAPVRQAVVIVDNRFDKIGSYIHFVKNGGVRIVDLERELAEYSTSASRVFELEQENLDLRLQLGVLDTNYAYQVARVVSVGDSLILAMDGPAEFVQGSMVVYKDTLVGTIESIGKYSTSVTKVSSLKIPVELVDSSSRKLGLGELVGDTGEIIISGVERSVKMNGSLLVVTTGAGDLVTKGVVVGRVREVLSSDSSVYQRAVVEPLLEISVGDSVYIVLFVAEGR